MNNYIQITFPGIQPGQQELLIAHLAELGYEGFEENPQELKAYINEKDFDHALLLEITSNYQVAFTQTIIPAQNWNEVWESNFEPVRFNDFVGIRADFHPPMEQVEHEIIITPKMSFGTGHHSTTMMMMGQMQDISFTGLSVLDFGTGTGVLAILAEKLGASNIVAIDNDEWSMLNAAENAARNQCRNIQFIKAEDAGEGRHFHVILANINRNVILDNMKNLCTQLLPGGVLLVSGFLEEDEPAITAAAVSFGLQPAGGAAENNWYCRKYAY
jgi:ribosomal protein L11 methyltransferase